MRIFLIRHGESVANTGENYELRVPDHLVTLSEEGRRQADREGKWLKEYCDKEGIDLSSARIWRSPFMRTRETADIFNSHLGITDVREDITLVEQQYGLFDARPESEWRTMFPKEYDEYKRLCAGSGKFYARTPMGESPFDVAVRVHQFMGTIFRDAAVGGPEVLFVFTHGATLRAFLLRWFHYSPEWYESERNPKNCAIREINGKNDLGYINL